MNNRITTTGEIQNENGRPAEMGAAIYSLVEDGDLAIQLGEDGEPSLVVTAQCYRRIFGSELDRECERQERFWHNADALETIAQGAERLRRSTKSAYHSILSNPHIFGLGEEVARYRNNLERLAKVGAEPYDTDRLLNNPRSQEYLVGHYLVALVKREEALDFCREILERKTTPQTEQIQLRAQLVLAAAESPYFSGFRE